METMSEKVEAYVKQAQVEAKFIDHEPADSADKYSEVLGTRLEQQVKVLLVRFKGRTKAEPAKGYVAVAVQANKQVNLDRIQKLLGAKSVRMADKTNLMEVTGCSFGEVHPFASLMELDLYMDKDLLEEETVYFNAGSLIKSAAISPQVIVDLESPELF